MQQGLGLSLGFMVRIVCCCFHCCHLFEYPVKVNYFYRKKESTEGYSAKIYPVKVPTLHHCQTNTSKGFIKEMASNVYKMIHCLAIVSIAEL